MPLIGTLRSREGTIFGDITGRVQKVGLFFTQRLTGTCNQGRRRYFCTTDPCSLLNDLLITSIPCSSVDPRHPKPSEVIKSIEGFENVTAQASLSTDMVMADSKLTNERKSLMFGETLKVLFCKIAKLDKLRCQLRLWAPYPSIHPYVLFIRLLNKSSSQTLSNKSSQESGYERKDL